MTLVLPALVAAPAAADVPDGCTVEADVVTCQWRFDTRDDPTTITRGFPFDVVDRSLVTITVLLEGVDNGWRLTLFRVEQIPIEGQENETYPRYVTLSGSRHDASPSTSNVHSETYSHLVFRESASDEFLLSFQTQSAGAFGVGASGAAGSSIGEFTITLTAPTLPEGVAPVRPAATRADPHTADVANDARQPEFDILAAWLDDARVGDGLMEAHLAVGNLAEPDFNFTSGTGFSPRIVWHMRFAVGGDEYAAQWAAFPNGSSTPRWSCNLLRYTETGSETIMEPVCAANGASGVLSATFPESSIGGPADGVLFERIRATSCTGDGITCYGEDAATDERYAFALGGPPVWDELNPRLAVREPPPAPWYRDPLAPDNLADSLQVGGALAAAGTFVAGAIVVRRHRQVTRRLLRDVESVSRAHDARARDALLALGRLQSAVSDEFHRGRLTEQQYQLVVQRIALEATKFALRRDLGLDDGEPGESDLLRA